MFRSSASFWMGSNRSQPLMTKYFTFLAATALFAQRPVQSPLEQLQASIERTTKSVNATWGIYIRNIDTGEEIAINATRQMETMSVIKIPLMAEVFYQVKEGKMKLADRYTISKDDIRPGTGVLRSLDPGAVVTVKDLLTLMIIVSDNTATDVLFRMTGGIDAVNRRMAAMGLTATHAVAPGSVWFAALRAAPGALEFYQSKKTPYGLSSPKDIGMLLEMMEKGTIVDEESSKQMLQILRGQIYRTRLPRFLSGISIPHKTGDFLPYIGNDVGVLELAPKNRVVICVFDADHYGDGNNLEEAVGRIAQSVAGYFQARTK